MQDKQRIIRPCIPAIIPNNGPSVRSCRCRMVYVSPAQNALQDEDAFYGHSMAVRICAKCLTIHRANRNIFTLYSEGPALRREETNTQSF
ncbi:hypothetical protein ACRALDRAFT_205287 [Sodiomyces alcalophilus JCM 7366]|uniref:uncharacterized protein n=1 Tax=Sodiomyces alcalophilus JCM 7366 TaxID=591952 RepID=UPI0039B51C0C